MEVNLVDNAAQNTGDLEDCKEQIANNEAVHDHDDDKGTAGLSRGLSTKDDTQQEPSLLETNGARDVMDKESDVANKLSDETEVVEGKSIYDEKMLSENFVEPIEKPAENFDAENNTNETEKVHEAFLDNGAVVNDLVNDGYDSGAKDSLLGTETSQASQELSQDQDEGIEIMGERGIPEGSSQELADVSQKEDSTTIKESEAHQDDIAASYSASSKNENTDDHAIEGTKLSEIASDTKEQKVKKDNEHADILGNGLLKKTVIIEGKGEETRPSSGNEVVINVSGMLNNGTILKGEELTFILDDREVVQAFDLAIALMELGEKASLYTDSKYAFGRFGCKDNGLDIPPNCNITYEIELISVKEIDIGTLSDDEIVAIGDRKRSRGNSFYARGDYGGAIDCYKRALKYLERSSNKKVNEMHIKCQNNLSAAQLKVNAFQAALLSCNSVLHAEPENVKALFRKGKCLEALGNSEDALKWMKKASMLDPNSKMIQTELVRISNYVKKNRQKESDMYKRMVDGLRDQDKQKASNDNSFSWKILAGTMMAAGVGIMAAFFLYRH